MTAPGAASPFLTYDIGAMPQSDSYKLFMGSVIPRPVAVVSSLNADGRVNVAPFSNFMIVSSADAFLAFSVGNDGPVSEVTNRYKDTQVNVRRNGEYVINLASDALAQKVQHTSQNFPPEVSEADEAGLTLLPSTAIKTPRIAECMVQFECQLHSLLTFGRTNLVIGKAVMVHVRSEIIADFKIDPRKFAPLGRIGGRRYVELGNFIDV